MRDHLKTILVIGLAVALMAFFLRSANLALVWAEIRQARLDLVAVALGAIAVSYVLRVGRWQSLLAPLGHVRFAPAARATFIGFATTAVLPGRLGEVLRPYLLARGERLSASAALATIVLERLLDLVAVVLLFGLFLMFFSDDLPQSDSLVLTALKSGGLVAALGAMAALALIVIAARAPERVARFVEKIERLIPHRFGAVAARFVTKFSAGLGIARHPGRFLRAFAWSFPLWLCVCIAAWCVCQAFGIALPPGGSLLIMVLMVLGVAVPTPAGVGGFHAAVQAGMTGFYAAPVDVAVGAALVLHVVAFGPVTLVGIVLMARDGLSFRRAVDLAASGATTKGGDQSADPGGAEAPRVPAADRPAVRDTLAGEEGRQ